MAFFSTRATISLLAGTIFDVYGAATKVPGAEDYGSTISLTTAAGHKVVRSAGLYLDQLCDTGEHDRFATMLLAALRFQTDGAGMRVFFGGPEGANKNVLQTTGTRRTGSTKARTGAPSRAGRTVPCTIDLSRTRFCSLPFTPNS